MSERWYSALDPKSGNTYYYNKAREIRWDAPPGVRVTPYKPTPTPEPASRATAGAARANATAGAQPVAAPAPAPTPAPSVGSYMAVDVPPPGSGAVRIPTTVALAPNSEAASGGVETTTVSAAAPAAASPPAVHAAHVTPTPAPAATANGVGTARARAEVANGGGGEAKAGDTEPGHDGADDGGGTGMGASSSAFPAARVVTGGGVGRQRSAPGPAPPSAGPSRLVACHPSVESIRAGACPPRARRSSIAQLAAVDLDVMTTERPRVATEVERAMQLGGLSPLDAAAMFVRDAVAERPLRKRLWSPWRCCLYRVYNNGLLRVVVIAVIVAHHLLALWEPNHTDGERYFTSFAALAAPPDASRDVTGWWCRVVETGFVGLYVLDLLLKACALGCRHFFMFQDVAYSHTRETSSVMSSEGWDRLRCVLVAVFITDLVLLWLGATDVHFSRALRPVFLVTYLRALRRWSHLFMRALPSVLPVFGLVAAVVAVFANVGMLLWESDSAFNSPDRDDDYQTFDNFGVSMLSLFVLFTTESYPDIMYPVYDRSQYAFLFFAGFFVVAFFVLANLLLPTVFRAFNKERREVAKHLHRNERRAMMAAFLCLQDQGELPYATFEQLVKKLRPKLNVRLVARELEYLAAERWDSAVGDDAFKHLITPIRTQYSGSPHAHLATPHKQWASEQRPLQPLTFFHLTAVLNRKYERIPRGMPSPGGLVTTAYVVHAVVALATVAVVACVTVAEEEVEVVAALLIVVAAVDIALLSFALGVRRVLSKPYIQVDVAVLTVAAGLWVAQLVGAFDDSRHHQALDRMWLMVLSLRLLQAVLSVRSLRVTANAVVSIGRFLAVAFGASVVLVYLFAIIGNELFSGGFLDVRNVPIAAASAAGNAAALTPTADPTAAAYCAGFAQAVADAGVALPLPSRCLLRPRRLLLTPPPPYFDDRVTFDTLSRSMFALFQLVTTSNWHEVMYQTMWSVQSRWASVYFVVFFIVSQYLVLNLVLAVFIDAFETRQWELDHAYKRSTLTFINESGAHELYAVKGAAVSRKLSLLSTYIAATQRNMSVMFDVASGQTAAAADMVGAGRRQSSRLSAHRPGGVPGPPPRAPSSRLAVAARAQSEGAVREAPRDPPASNPTYQVAAPGAPPPLPLPSRRSDSPLLSMAGTPITMTTNRMFRGGDAAGGDATVGNRQQATPASPVARSPRTAVPPHLRRQASA